MRCCIVTSIFQSTLLQEERHILRLLLSVSLNISIHAPTRGATVQNVLCAVRQTISIHAPTRGATVELAREIKSIIFQSTLLQEERHIKPCSISRFFLISIHAPTRGATRNSKQQQHSPIFQSTLLQEERRATWNLTKEDSDFNPRSYKRSDSKNAQYSLCISAIIIA